MPHKFLVQFDEATHDYIVGMSTVMRVSQSEFIRLAINMMRTTPARYFPTSDVTTESTESSIRQGEAVDG